MNSNYIITPVVDYTSVQKIEVTDKVLGGDLGAINIQAQQLANRDAYILNVCNSKLDTSYFSNNSSITSDLSGGYQIFPNGLIIQWGIVTGSNSATDYKYFKKQDWTACLSLTVTYAGGQSAYGTWAKLIDKTKFMCGIANDVIATAGERYYYQAIGYIA